MNKYLGNIGKTTFNKEATEAHFQDKYKRGATLYITGLWTLF